MDGERAVPLTMEGSPEMEERKEDKQKNERMKNRQKDPPQMNQLNWSPTLQYRPRGVVNKNVVILKKEVKVLVRKS